MSGVALVPAFKSNLKRLILKKSFEMGEPLTQKEIAEATGLSLPTIARWYKGDVDRLEAETVVKLMTYFECEFDDLVELVRD
jgi:DNA-binding Xre family transcriptional regulator